MSTFKVGDRVAYVEDMKAGPDGNEPIYGVVTDALSSGKYLVRWDDSWYNTSSHCYSDAQRTDVLISETEAKAKYSELEKTYAAVEKEVEAHLDEAAKLIRKAAKVASKNGLELSEMSSTLENVMDECGWNTSSWNC